VNILVIAQTTFGDAVRKKILNIFLFVTLALIAFSVSFASFSMREELTIIKSFGLGIIAIAGMFMAVILGIYLIPTEVEKRTIYTLLAKPINRYEFLLGKFLGSIFTILANLILMSVVFFVMVTWRNNWVPEWALWKGVLMIFFQLFLLSAVALFFSAFLTPVVNFFLTAAVYIIGSLSDVTMSMANKGNANPVVKGFYWLIHYLVPNFANFFTQNPLIHPSVVVRSEFQYYAQNILYAIVYTAVLMIIAIMVFDRRDM
jgi:ABC-type transport system involved in multi-copper enzyme maturation permease subunit